MEAILVTVKGQGPFFTATLKTKSIKQPSNWPVSFSAPPPISLTLLFLYLQSPKFNLVIRQAIEPEQ